MRSPRGDGSSISSRGTSHTSMTWGPGTYRSIGYAWPWMVRGRPGCRVAALRVAMLSVHGCPLARPGTPEAGGMQMYVKALSRELGRRGLIVDVFTRRTDEALPTIVPFGVNARVIHLDAGEPAPIDKNAVADVLPEFVCNLQRFRRIEG